VLTPFFWPAGLAALTFGALCYRELRQNSHVRALMWPLRVVFWLGAGFILFLVMTVSYFQIKASRRSLIASNEASALSDLREMKRALAAFSQKHGQYPNALSELDDDMVRVRRLSESERHGYRFVYKPVIKNTDPELPQRVFTGFVVEAIPTQINITGTVSFTMDQSGQITFREAGKPNAPIEGRTQ
jgi:hypothetical protein